MSMLEGNWWHYRVLFNRFRKPINTIAKLTLFLVSLASAFLLAILLGYSIDEESELEISHIFSVFLVIFFFASTIRFIFNFKEVIKEKLLVIDLILYIFLFAVIIGQVFYENSFLSSHYITFTILALLAFINISKFVFDLLSSKINPSLLFIYSFLFIIIIGAILLMLPKSTVHSISFSDALFTSTTSVCVTGLCTIDVPTTFTFSGQLIILCLIQIGGIGVMTFTSFFALSFSSNSSFGGAIVLRDFLNEKNLGNMFKTLIKILIVTFIIESLGAYLIWNNIHGKIGSDLKTEIFNSVFHSISAFCNAGISVFEGNLSNPLVSQNYNFIFFISILIILGGIGFPILFNYMTLTRHWILNLTRMLLGKQKHFIHKARIINTHTRVVITGTFILIVGGTILCFLFEENHAHLGMSLKGKWISSLFEAVTPRTAGFNTLDMGSFTRSTLVVTFIFMLIGAAPMSTGGGMKVSSIFIAIMSALDTARGKKHAELAGREINSSIVNRAFSVILLYLIWMFIALIILSFTEEDTSIFKLLFETASALSTVGLSLDVTSTLSISGKYVIIMTMFVGRIGVLTFFTGILKRYQPKSYKYPEANVIIG